MKDYFVLTYSTDCDVESALNAIQTLQSVFPDKYIIGLPEIMNLKNYTKEELINFLESYSIYMKGLINE